MTIVWCRRFIVAGVAAAALGVPALAAAAVTGACHVSPVVADLDRSVRFYRDVLGFDVQPAPGGGPIPWDTSPELRQLHGLPGARVRYVAARVPGARCGVELVEFERADGKPVRRRMQDPGAVTLILLVRDIDAAFARLKAAGTEVVSTGGAPVTPSPTSKTRAIIVKDPDGHFVELAQLVPAPATTAPASSNIFDIRFRITVSDAERAAQYYRDQLGIPGQPGAFARTAGVMAMMGLPETVEYRLSVTQVPGSSLTLEFLELKGIERATMRARVQDPGAYRLQLTVDDVDATAAALRATGSRVISTGGAPVRMLLRGPWHLAAVEDVNNLFLVLQQQLPVAGPDAAGAPGSAPVQSLHVRGNVWVIVGAGGNITVQAAADARAAGPGAGEGVLLVNTGRREMTAAVLAEIRKIAPGRIEYIINTDADPDHVGGNEIFANPRMDFLWTPGTITGPGVKVIGHENVLPRMSTGPTPYPTIAWPTNTYSSAQRKMSFNDEPIVIMHEPAAHTDGDSIVLFRRSDVISAGDIFLTTTYPVIDASRGGSVAGIIRGLNHLLDLMVPRYNQDGGTYVIPGHGRIGDQHDVLEYRDMLVIVSDRIRSAVEKGMTLEQVKAMKPTIDYDARWGATTGSWTTDMFIGAVYADAAARREAQTR
jgi:cyclase